MSGLAPATVYISAALTAVLGFAWLVAKVARAGTAAKHFAIVFGSCAATCFSFLILDKTVDVSYTRGLYAAIGVTVVVGVLAGVAIRRVGQ